MPINPKYNYHYAYHFTSLHNLESVIDTGLLSTNQKNLRDIQHFNIAEASIQGRRSTMPVPGSNKKHVHDYVPFYFAKRTPMQMAVIQKKNVDQQFIIYFAVSLKIIDHREGVFFTDASANTDIPPNFYDSSRSDCLDKLNWKIINSGVWSYPDDNERHQKMAELLVPESVLMREVDHIVVWNDSIAQCVRDCFKSKNVPCPNIISHGRYYYVDQDDIRHSLITGPYYLKKEFEETVDNITKDRSTNTTYSNLQEALVAIRNNFGSIKELDDIDGLRANYGPHKDDVGTHSRRVADLVLRSPEYIQLDEQNKMILEAAAYLHDIGKGPKSRWTDSYMHKADNNHARKSLPMLERILTQDIGGLSEEEVRRLVMLITYDDLLGDIAARGRDREQLFDIITCETDVNMLVALSRADIGSINQGWLLNTYDDIEQLRVDAFRFLGEKNQC
jgi:hypothetical protein